MTVNVGIGGDAAHAYELLRGDRQRTLVAPEDDMWATFADRAAPHSLLVGERLVGRFSVDTDDQLHGFFVSEELEPRAADLLVRVVTELNICAAMVSTVDPRFLALSLTAGGEARPVALMYDHVAKPGSDDGVELRIATTDDHAAAVAFDLAATGSPSAFLTRYLAERIGLGELYLVARAGEIVATGECRVDRRAPGNAHLGFVVGAQHRGQGLGTRLLRALTEIAAEQHLVPRCSTEPTNLAAQKAIRRAGFRSRHHVFRVAMSRA